MLTVLPLRNGRYIRDVVVIATLLALMYAMAVLIEERVEQNVADTRHELLEWHSKNGRLAVSSYNPNFGGEVNFFTHHVQRVEQNVADTRHELLEWHSKNGRLAVSSYNPNFGGEVNFFTHHGGKSESLPVRKADARVTQLKWHPDDDIIATAWNNGDVVLRCVDENNDFLLPVDEDPLDEIRCLVWNSSGSLIFVADKVNISLNLWKFTSNEGVYVNCAN
uniref:ANAPC4_WD40 domain-containing protein n=1 Tax=Ascaris lumbricoides TaxID=6252 RepID=A0A0M3IUG5_ASCLU